MADLGEAESRMTAREVLRDAYRADVDLLASEMAARVRRGEFDKSFPWFANTLHRAIRMHARVSDVSLALETVSYSSNRNAIETDFITGWSEEQDGPWSKFQLPVDPDTYEPCHITLPAWRVIAYLAFSRDLSERLLRATGRHAGAIHRHTAWY
jgi:hypothetical protein